VPNVPFAQGRSVSSNVLHPQRDAMTAALGLGRLTAESVCGVERPDIPLFHHLAAARAVGLERASAGALTATSALAAARSARLRAGTCH
jgi:hypothetical protein